MICRESRAHILLLSALLVVGVGCSTAYYSFWEALGREKRDLLRSNVESVQDEQEAAADHFESALDRLRELTSVEAGDLEKVYDKIDADYEEAAERAGEISERIDTIDDIADDLFAEWEDEIGQISSARLKAKSRQKLAEARQNYAGLESSLRAAEASMDPVLTHLRDTALYLKHNLNAAEIGGLSAEVATIESDIEALLADMRSSIAEAERFLSTLPG